MEQRKITRKTTNTLAYLQVNENLGTESIDNEDLIIPRLKIVQDQTREKFGAKTGEFINNVTGKCYGNAIEIIPVYHWKARILFNEDFTIACRSLDGKVNQEGQLCAECPKRLWQNDKAPECNLIYNYLIAIRSELKEAIKEKVPLPPLTLSFMKTGIKTAKLINTTIKLNATRGIPIYGQIFNLTTVEKEFKIGKAFVPDAKISGFVTQIEFDYLKNLYKEFSKMRIDMTKVLNGDEVKEEMPDTEVI